MVKEEINPFGYIYRATNRLNGKNYIGQTVTSRWGVDKIPIEARWKEEIRESYSRNRRGEELRNIEKAIIKRGPENFILREQDRAYSQEDLDAKETYWIKDYDSMNPDKGYNMTEGGLGGRLSDEVREKLSTIGSEKWNKDQVYRDKQTNERRERANNPDWLDKMANVNQEIARNPEYQKNMSKAISNKWQEQQYQDSVSKGATNKWQEAKHRGRQFKSRVEGKREIPDKGEFLRDIQDMKKKDINTKYDMDGKSINVRIKEMLGHRGVNNYSEAKKYLDNKNLDNVLKDINEKLNEQPNEFKGKKEIPNMREFLEDIQNIQAKEIAQKYEMNSTTVNKRIREMLGEYGVKNYTEAKNYLQDKNLDEVVKGINERLKDQSHITEGKTIISDKKEFLKDIQELQKNEIDQKYGMDSKTVNRKIEELLGEHGVRNYTGAKEYLKDKNLDDVLKDIDNSRGEREDGLSENANEEQKDERSEESKQEEDNEKQSEEENKEINDKYDEDSTEEIPEKNSDENLGDQKEDVLSEENRERGKAQNDIMKSEKRLETKSMIQPSDRIVPVLDTPHGCQGLIPPEGDKDNRGQKPKEKRKKEIPGYILTSGEEQRQPDRRSVKDYDGLDKSLDGKGSDYDGIDTPSEDAKSDIKSLDGGDDEQGNDYEGIDNPQEIVDKDYDKLDESYGEGGHEG